MEALSLPSNTLTGRLRQYLEEQDTVDVDLKQAIESTDSIITKARMQGLTLRQYVKKNPDIAVYEAEGSVHTWERICEEAILHNAIIVGDDITKINKNTVDLLKSKIEWAKRDLAEVHAIADELGAGSRGQVLVNALYNRAINGKDTRALLYLIDRVEGRTTESKQVDLDYDNELNIYKILHSLFDKQLEVLNSGPGVKVVMCSRRSGKTHLAAALCLITCLSESNATCIYIGETMQLGEQILGAALNQIIRDCNLKDKSGNALNWKKFDNGSHILIR